MWPCNSIIRNVIEQNKKEISTFTSSVTIFLATQAFHDNILHAYICKTGSNPTIVLQDIAISAIFVVSYLSLGVSMAVFAVTWRNQQSSLDVISRIHDSLAAASVSYVHIWYKVRKRKSTFLIRTSASPESCPHTQTKFCWSVIMWPNLQTHNLIFQICHSSYPVLV